MIDEQISLREDCDGFAKEAAAIAAEKPELWRETLRCLISEARVTKPSDASELIMLCACLGAAYVELLLD